MAMMAITTSNSIKVKARFLRAETDQCLAQPSEAIGACFIMLASGDRGPYPKNLITNQTLIGTIVNRIWMDL